jgi:ATP-dependent Lon protease
MERTPPADHLPEELPVLALREFVVFPYMVLPLFVTRDHSIAAVEEALGGDRLILLVAHAIPRRRSDLTTAPVGTSPW